MSTPPRPRVRRPPHASAGAWWAWRVCRGVSPWIGLAVVGGLALAPGCTQAVEQTTCPGGTIVGGECVPSGAGAAFADTQAQRESDAAARTDGAAGAGGPSGGGTEGPADDRRTAGGDGDDNRDRGTVDDQAAEWTCPEGLAGVRPIGAECSRHCECGSSYCYDEAYLGAFRFCTLESAAACNAQDASEGVVGHTTLNLKHSALASLALTRTTLCMPICSSVADCEALSTSYDKCGTPTPSGTHWGPVGSGTASYLTLSLQRTCQIAAEVAQLP